MRSSTKRKLLWLISFVVILYVIFFISYNLFISKMSFEENSKISAYLWDSIMMQVTIGGLISIGVLIAGAVLIDLIVSKNSSD